VEALVRAAGFDLATAIGAATRVEGATGLKLLTIDGDRLAVQV